MELCDTVLNFYSDYYSLKWNYGNPYEKLQNERETKYERSYDQINCYFGHWIHIRSNECWLDWL